jgi:hypothetical protein
VIQNTTHLQQLGFQSLKKKLKTKKQKTKFCAKKTWIKHRKTYKVE